MSARGARLGSRVLASGSPSATRSDGYRSFPRTAWSRRFVTVRQFAATENAGVAVLVAAVVVALLWANSPWSATYERVWNSEFAIRLGGSEMALDLRDWVNEGLMTFFFFVVGLEIRREFDMGELRQRRRVAMPILATIGGMVAAALIYVIINAGRPSVHGWGTVVATDTAFALALLGLVRPGSPRSRAFLVSMVVIDDLVALLIVAFAYTDHVKPGALAIALALFLLVPLMRRTGVRHGVPYALVGLSVWAATLASGVQPTVAGILLGLLVAAYPPQRDQIGRAGQVWRRFREEPGPVSARDASRTLTSAVSPNERLQHLIHPWTSFVIVPLFALANAGVSLDATVLNDALRSRITIGIVAGLVVGKFVGVVVVSWLASGPRIGLPITIPISSVAGVGAVAGIGFTVALLIADVAFVGADLQAAKVGVLVASLMASLFGWGMFRLIDRIEPAARRNDGRSWHRSSISARPSIGRSTISGDRRTPMSCSSSTATSNAATADTSSR